MDPLLESIRDGYQRITGKQCEISIFVVRKDSRIGSYYVHPIGTCDFYLVDVKC